MQEVEGSSRASQADLTKEPCKPVEYCGDRGRGRDRDNPSRDNIVSDTPAHRRNPPRRAHPNNRPGDRVRGRYGNAKPGGGEERRRASGFRAEALHRRETRNLGPHCLHEAAGEVYDGLSKTNPHFKKLYESLVSYRATAYAWLQVAELGFDNFMMRMRTRT